jgi:predicted nucleic acid-binding protein
MVKKARIYLDTSVFGGFFDKEFEEYTKPLFERIANGEFTVVISDATKEELVTAPEHVRTLLASIGADYIEAIKTTDETLDLAEEYITENVVGQTSFTDCVHIALATIHNVSCLISWNFKHIVNMQRIRGYNTINLRNGYALLEIRSPREFAL